MGREKIPQTRCRAISLAPCGQPWTGSSVRPRRRRLVLGVWIVLLVGSVPFAAQQTKNLTAGGFEVPGSGSPGGRRGDQALPRRPDRAARPRLRQQQEATPPRSPRRSTRPRRRSQGIDDVGVSPTAAARPGRRRSADRADGARRHRRARTPRSTPRWTCARTSHIQATATGACPSTSSASRRCGPACRTSPRRTSRRPSAPASRSSSSSCSPSSARSPRRCCRSASASSAVVVTGAAVYFLSQTMQMSIFVTNIASMLGIGVAVDYSLFILSRYREELHGGADPETRSRDRDADLGPGRRRLRRDRDHLARRAVPDRLQDDALDGDRRDRRRRHRGARGRDAAARADRDARAPRRTSRAAS